MTVSREPWWSSGAEPDEEGASSEVEDIVDAHRAARRGDADPHDLGGGHVAQDPAPDERAHDGDVCGICPICTGARLLAETHPELLAHLTEAARHLAAAARALIDEPQQASESPPDDRPTRIDLE